jgi:hypothetical protein
MKRVILLFIIICLSFSVLAQNVGINILNPSTRLHVKGTGSGNQILLEETGGTMLRLSNEASSAGPYLGTSSNHRLSFVSNNIVRGQFETNGNLGIGVAIAQKPLSVGGGAVIDQNDLNTGTISNVLSFGNNSSEGLGSKRNAGIGQFGLDFYTAGNKRMSISNNGNIGIGTDNPIANLDIMVGSNRNFQFKNDVVPTLDITSNNTNDGLAGIMRLRNAIEIMPSVDATRSGKLDVRNTAGSATILLNGANGEITANKLNAPNMPSFGQKINESCVFIFFVPVGIIDEVLVDMTVEIPAAGTAFIVAGTNGFIAPMAGVTSPDMHFKLDEYVPGGGYIATRKKFDLFSDTEVNPTLKYTFTSSGPETKRFKFKLYKNGPGPGNQPICGHYINVNYFPNTLTVN